MKKGIRKTISIIAILTMTFQLGMPIIPMSQTEVLSTNETTVEQQSADEQAEVTEEISRDYEIKDEETWDISANGDGSVIAKWTLKDRTLTISGTGEMKDWDNNVKEDWHNTQYTNAIENVIIYDGVTNIGGYTFSRCINLVNLTIQESVISIGSMAFFECISLKNINIPESVTSIDYGTFYDCSSLESINVTDDNKNYSSENGILFNKEKTELIKYPNGKEDLQEYIIPEGVTSIEDYAFEGCSSLTNITIPEGVTSIGYDTFYKCINLNNIVIPDGITKIEGWAFLGCINLISINIPEGITSIEDGVFYGCSSLIDINIPEGVTSIGKNAFSGCSNLKNINIPEGITSIEESVFYGCSSLIDINIPEGVTSIGKNAFSGCSNLKNINIPEGITSIGDNTFYGCSKLVISVKADSIGHQYLEQNKIGYILEGKATNVNTNYRVKEEETWDISVNGDESVIAKWTLNDRTLTISGIGEMKKWDSTSIEDWHNTQYTNVIENVIINEGVTNIGNDAFYECSSLKTIDVPESIINIGGWIFSGCSSLESINVEDKNEKYTSENGILFNKEKTEIIKYPQGKKDIQEYVIPEGVIKIESYAFEECNSLTNIEIPEGVTSIKWRAFSECSSLRSIVIPEGIIIIEGYTFYNCSSLTNIKIPQGITSIEELAFYGCSSLTNIIIPESVTDIGINVFTGCSSLASINIPRSVINIGGATFSGCTSLESINVDAENEKYTSENGILFNKEKTEIIKYPTEKKDIQEYKIPDGVISIKSYAFEGCNSLRNLTIPSSVRNIEYHAFEGCSGLTDITILEGITSIKSHIFYNCDNLTSINIPQSITDIEDYAINERAIIYTKLNTEGHRYAEESQQGYILIFEKGDINKDTNVDVTDLLMLKRYLVAGNKTEWILTGRALLLADMNEDGNIDITDMLMLKRKIVNNI